MSSSSRIIRFLCALVGYSGVQWSSGCWVRALVWDGLFLAYLLLVFHLPMWIPLALALAQAIDAAVLEPKADRSPGALAVAGLLAVASLTVVAVLARAFWVEAFRSPSGSMIPALQVGDHWFADKTARHPRRGDVVVFAYPKDPSIDFVKRVVAVGGDTIEIRDNAIVLNGTPVPRVHVEGPCEYQDHVEETGQFETRSCDPWDETLDGHSYRVIHDRNGGQPSWPPVTVPPDSYFVMGDNRDNSHDSRYWGFVPQALIKGVARKIWFSEGPDGSHWHWRDEPIR